ncbi:Uncharacterised protein [Mycobacteroides abscessus subsp. abscessus]|nr:Uncharacterised protein [Mycobacteroides abscessus subsp. abscessus]
MNALYPRSITTIDFVDASQSSAPAFADCACRDVDKSER